MDVKRRLALLTAAAWLILGVQLAQAGPFDACAQRVIRDWYAGGRVDGVYPLGCYRAAIRALPTDVLEYSDADKDIARALAAARTARQADDPPEPRPSAPAATESGAAVERRPSVRPLRPERPNPPSQGAPARGVDGPRRVAAGPEPVNVSAAVPYPVIVLAALAATLLATGAAGWLLARRR